MFSLKKREKLASKVHSLKLGFCWKDRSNYSYNSGIQREQGRPGRGRFLEMVQHDGHYQPSWSCLPRATWACKPSRSPSFQLSVRGQGAVSRGELGLTLAQMCLASTGFLTPLPSPPLPLSLPFPFPSHSVHAFRRTVPLQFIISFLPFPDLIPISHTHRIGACYWVFQL